MTPLPKRRHVAAVQSGAEMPVTIGHSLGPLNTYHSVISRSGARGMMLPITQQHRRGGKPRKAFRLAD